MTTKAKNKTVLILGCMAIVLGLGAYVFPESASDSPARIYFQTMGGSVLFTHHVHTDPSRFKYGNSVNVSKIACADCHHEMVQSDQVVQCKKCHSDEDYSGDDMPHSELVQMHPPSCTICHNARKGKVKACKECHLHTGQPKPVSCDKCHPGDGYAPDDLTHEELENIKGHWCTECHSVRRNADAIHLQCNRCHNKLERGTYIKKEKPDDEAFGCALCHLKSH
jgi:hypothetical protein